MFFSSWKCSPSYSIFTFQVTNLVIRPYCTRLYSYIRFPKIIWLHQHNFTIVKLHRYKVLTQPCHLFSNVHPHWILFPTELHSGTYKDQGSHFCRVKSFALTDTFHSCKCFVTVFREGTGCFSVEVCIADDCFPRTQQREAVHHINRKALKQRKHQSSAYDNNETLPVITCILICISTY